MERDTFERARQQLRFSRREFARWGRDAIAALLLLSTQGCRTSGPASETAGGEKASSETEYALMFFKPHEAATVEAVSSRIIPSNSTPGAREAKVINFIDYMLANAYKTAQPLYREGVGRLDEISQRRLGRPFINLSEVDQDSILAQMERGATTEWPKAGEFFSIIRMHTIEGMFSDPSYHGNFGQAGWKLVGETH